MGNLQENLQGLTERPLDSVQWFKKKIRWSIAALTNLYAILGIERDADIRSAYRRLARQCDPDVSGEADSLRFLEIRHAYETLLNPASRAAYDRSLTTTIPVRIIGNQPSHIPVEPLRPPRRPVQSFTRYQRSVFVEEDPFEEFYRIVERFFGRF